METELYAVARLLFDVPDRGVLRPEGLTLLRVGDLHDPFDVWPLCTPATGGDPCGTCAENCPAGSACHPEVDPWTIEIVLGPDEQTAIPLAVTAYSAGGPGEPCDLSVSGTATRSASWGRIKHLFRPR
jgi:hypothetical protein